MNFIWLDWAMIVAFLLLTTGIAFMTRRLISNYDSFLLAGRSLKLYLGMATMGATELGLVTLMYFSEQGYKSGFSAFAIGVISLLGFVFVGKTGFIIKGLRDLRMHTIAEFFGLRYSRSTQIVAAIITFAAGLMNMGLFLVLGAKFLLYMVGLPPEALPYLMVGLLLLVLLYTVVGGMVSVVLTDYVQFIILFTSVVLTTYFAITHVGYDAVIAAVQIERGAGGFDPFLSDDLGWLFIVWLVFGLPFTGMWPPALSRALSTVDGETSRKLYGFIGLSFLGRALMPMMWGICAFAYFAGADAVPLPMVDGAPDTAAAMPVYLSQILPNGLRGLVVAAALAALMSTFDSYLLCWSSILVNDIVLPLRPELKDRQKILLTRLSVVGCGLFVLGWGYLYSPPETFFRFMAITGTMYSASVLLTTAMGLYWKKANTPGTLASLCVAGLLPLTTIFLDGSGIVPPAYEWMIEDKVVGIATFVASVVFIVVASLLTQKSHPPKVLQPVGTGGN